MKISTMQLQKLLEIFDLTYMYTVKKCFISQLNEKTSKEETVPEFLSLKCSRILIFQTDNIILNKIVYLFSIIK